MAFRYFVLDELVEMMDEPFRFACRRILDENRERFRIARGSSHNHQAWAGGYLDHIQESMNLAVLFYRNLNSLRSLPFSLSDALAVLFAHDLEKPWKYTQDENGTWTIASGLQKKGAQKEFRAEKLREYGIKLTADQENAMQYVEGIPDAEYASSDRIMNPLAAFCHLCDVTSGRIWFDYPSVSDDPWAGAKRVL